MNRFDAPGTMGLVALLLAACCPAEATSPQTTPMMPEETATQVTATMPPIDSTSPFPLLEPGPYQFGMISGTRFTDPSRNDRKVGITAMYPAREGNPDLSGAPYPMILSSTKVAYIFGDQLASYGFVIVGIDGIDTYYPWDQNLVDQPLDILFALEQVASSAPEGLDGMIDTDHVGVMGYSFDGYNSLALSGARIDPESYLARCAEDWVKSYCTVADEWNEFVAYAGSALTDSDDELWQPMTDERIRAVMPMAPEGVWLFGERGLAAVDRPTLIIGATEDEGCPYESEAVYIFEHIGTPDKFLISFVGQGHMMVYDDEQVARMKHFAVAFFGYYLQGRQDLAQYFSEDFVAQCDGLAWGVYQGE